MCNKPPIPLFAIHFLPISSNESPLLISEHQRKAHGYATNPSELNLLGSVCEIPLLISEHQQKAHGCAKNPSELTESTWIGV
jgi:hypothetical protein